MISFFKKQKIDIRSISVPNFGWTMEKETESIIQWINPDEAMALSVNFFPSKPDIPSVKDLDKIRQFYRMNIAQVNGGLIVVESQDFDGIKGIKTIFKIPQESAGITYLASCTIPFAKYSYVVKLQVPELGIPGFRESTISKKLIKDGVINSNNDGWASDPYDTSYRGGTRMNKSEEATYDSKFPSHPLTLARKYLAEVAANITFKDDARKVKGFNK